MQASFISTEGYGLEAVVEIDGRRFHVMDEVSDPDAPVAPGSVHEIELSAVCLGDEDWERIFSVNPEKQIGLEHLSGWTYRAYGRIIRIEPVVVECGVLRIEGEIRTHDERCVGAYVGLEISRLDCHASRECPGR